ncbi:UDP-glycosyltransferase 89B1 [Ananas comosus]|uniref:UDP-glycosyltransferase 89B1 n=1 Tax=Ananas comosus TaxID=4615 RepID=A0A199VR29_ANACO|nr:UDP-glycosyltransferase 89B1 [Ananas comosus]
MAETHDGAPHVLVIPFPAQGHMLPLLDLAHLLARRGVAVTVAVSSGNLPLLSPLLSKSPSIQPLSLPLSPLPPPGPRERQGHGPDLLRHPDPRPRLSPRPAPLLGPGPPEARLRRRLRHLRGLGPAPRRRARRPWLRLLPLRRPRHRRDPLPLPAHAQEARGRGEGEGEGEDYLVPFPSIPNSPSYPLPKLSRLFRSYKEGDPLSESVRRNFLWNLESHGFVANSFEALEAAYLERPLDDLARKRVWAVGPLAAAAAEVGGAGAADDRGGPSSVPAAEVSAWLDRFPEGSVVYVCFGSLAVLTPAQAAAAAAALERSGAAFVWAARGGTAVPEGFEERVGGRGLVLRGWAPQVAILAHAAVGWFVTHCGWNSLVEAAAAGVAMLTWPMTADQHVNARLLVEEAGVALPACDGGLAAVPDPHELARTLAEAVRGEKGRAVRDRAKELGRKAVEAVRGGGSSYIALEEFIQELHNLNTK